MDIVNQLKGRTFTWKDEANMVSGNQYGVIAQELESVLPDLVIDYSIRKQENGDYYKSANMNGIVPVLIEAVKELSTKLDTMQTEINILKG